jgi:hypothetical protein
LATLIRDFEWDSVLAKLKIMPMNADQELKVTTRGGFTSTFAFTPLHFACERRPPLRVVEALIAACPAAVAKRAMPGGALPIHIACTWQADAKIIKALLAADKSTCKGQDELGNLPLHSATFSGTGTPVIERLLRTYPKATLSRNHQGSLPEEISKRLRHENRRSVMTLLSITREEVLAKRNEKNHRRHLSADGCLGRKMPAYKGLSGPPTDEFAEGVEVSYSKKDDELVWI